MKANHLERATLERLLARDLDEVATQQALTHLASCDRCWDRAVSLAPGAAVQLENWLWGGDFVTPAPIEVGAYSEILARTKVVLSACASRLTAEKNLARTCLAELDGLDFDQRLDLVQQDPRFHSRIVAQGLLERCRGQWAQDPAEAESLTHLALAVVDRLDATAIGAPALNDLRAQCWAYNANCRRVQSDFRSAERSVEASRFFLERGSGDPLLLAEMLDLLASFRRDQQQYNEALELLNQAAAAYAEAGDRHLVGRALVKKTSILADMGQPEKSITLLERAIPMIDTAREPRLSVNIHHQLILYLHQASRDHEALALLPKAIAVVEKTGNRLDRVRLSGVEGLIAASLGQFDKAEQALLAAREGFIREGIGYDAALVSLDLAALFLRQSRTAETRRLALEILPIFQSRDIHREAMAALMIFRSAAELEAASLSMVEDIAGFLKRARRNPSLHYEPQVA
ncbi:MAG TPA: tetratricopeptide repeat protein [Thermoanaerobaculia bacterium]|nr:tetratricopeptide repeat protein [Thermoanaerobaculia bacterium]